MDDVLDLQERLYSHLKQIVRDRDPYLATAGHFFVQQYIHEQLAQCGNVEIFEFQVRGKTHQNLILNIPGMKCDRPPVLIGAHYDTIPGTPGADDNATGVAVLLELARILSVKPTTKSPLRLVAFDLEEYGLLGGSGASEYAAYLRQQQQHLKLMISLEMLGYCDSNPGTQQYPAPLNRFYPNRGDFIALIGNLPTIPNLISLSRSIRKVGIPSEWLPVFNRGLIVPQTRLSDHAHFWDQNYPAMMITDTAMLRNPHYHKASDTIKTLDMKFLTGVCYGLVQGLCSL